MNVEVTTLVTLILEEGHLGAGSFSLSSLRGVDWGIRGGGVIWWCAGGGGVIWWAGFRCTHRRARNRARNGSRNGG